MLARIAVQGRTRPLRSVVDLAAGPGAISLCLLTTGSAERAIAIEIDPHHAELARRNAASNGVRMEVITSDVADVTAARGELVIANPPWFEPSTGPIATGDS